MKRRDLERHLRTQGCRVLRQGSRHTIWEDESAEQTAPVPRHREIGPAVVRAACKQLGIQLPPNVR